MITKTHLFIQQIQDCQIGLSGGLDITEMKMLEAILQEGNEKGCFNVQNIKLAAAIIQCSLKGCEVPFIRGDLRAFLQPQNRKNFANFILSGLLEKPDSKRN